MVDYLSLRKLYLLEKVFVLVEELLNLYKKIKVKKINNNFLITLRIY